MKTSTIALIVGALGVSYVIYRGSKSGAPAARLGATAGATGATGTVAGATGTTGVTGEVPGATGSTVSTDDACSIGYRSFPAAHPEYSTARDWLNAYAAQYPDCAPWAQFQIDHLPPPGSGGSMRQTAPVPSGVSGGGSLNPVPSGNRSTPVLRTQAPVVGTPVVQPESVVFSAAGPMRPSVGYRPPQRFAAVGFNKNASPPVVGSFAPATASHRRNSLGAPPGPTANPAAATAIERPLPLWVTSAYHRRFGY